MFSTPPGDDPAPAERVLLNLIGVTCDMTVLHVQTSPDLAGQLASALQTSLWRGTLRVTKNTSKPMP